MERFDIEEARKAPRRRRSFNLVWNILAILMLMLTICVGVFLLQIFLNPYSTWNPFPPPTLIPMPPTLTPTITLRVVLEPSWTPTIAIPTQTFTPRPTNTALVSATPSVLPSFTATMIAATATPGDFAFALMDGSPQWIAGATFHPELGCDWIGVAGQVEGLNGDPILYQFIHLGGILEGQEVGEVVATGTAPAIGPGGFEFIIAPRLVATTGSLWIQMEDIQGLPMSDRIYFDTFADCEQNLVIIYLQQVR